MRSVDDVTSVNIFGGVLGDEEEHIDYLGIQIGPVSQFGGQFYLAQLAKQPDDRRGRPSRPGS
jgi:bacterioferritin